MRTSRANASRWTTSPRRRACRGSGRSTLCAGRCSRRAARSARSEGGRLSFWSTSNAHEPLACVRWSPRARARIAGACASARRGGACASLRSRSCREPACTEALAPGREAADSSGVQRLLDQIDAAAIISHVRGDYLAANALGRALYAPVFESPEQPANSARFTFLDPAAPDFYPEWDRLASGLVAALRSHAGRHPHDRALHDLIGELWFREERRFGARRSGLVASLSGERDARVSKARTTATRSAWFTRLRRCRMQEELGRLMVGSALGIWDAPVDRSIHQRELESLLAQVPLFRGLSGRHLRRVASVTEHEHCPAGTDLVRA